jgi:uncharacterized protein (TIGR03435 family)
MKMPKMTIQRAGLIVLFLTAAAFGQTGPQFEVASIKKAEPLNANLVMSGNLHIGMTVDAAMVNIKSLSLAEMLRVAYKVQTFQISGPEWLNAERFDVIAKMPAGATRDQVPQMIQALLADRFKLTLHRSTTEQPVYALVVTKSGKLKESPPDTDTPATSSDGAAAPLAPTPTDGGAQVRAVATSNAGGVVSTASINGNMKMVPSDNGMRLEITKMNTIGMVEMLGRFVDRPIVDMSELKGRYDLTLDVGLEDLLNLARSQGVAVPMRRADAAGAASVPGSSSVFAAIQQYGLKLEPRKAPIELLVVDHVEKTPTEN